MYKAEKPLYKAGNVHLVEPAQPLWGFQLKASESSYSQTTFV
jgi:hypothetical protein